MQDAVNLDFFANPIGLARAWTEYVVDTQQRAILFLDVLRRRGNQTRDALSRTAPHVLSFGFDLVMDGRTLARPVNYGLVRIQPPEGVRVDPAKRPFIVFDPRAGHGPGIGGMKRDSEIGAVLHAGHPCYFVGFLPNPVPGQTIEDVCRAEAAFIERVRDLHPLSPSRPALIGNCQAGWQILLTAAVAPDLPGPILVAGSPLSYWAGTHGHAPLRYLGGLTGGTWLTALCGDLGGGVFDGAHLIANFESMNPANTFFKKAYDVFADVDRAASRFLGFEAWWGNPVLLNAGEMQWIADNLFVGNRLTLGALTTSDGIRIDLRNIRSPIIVFCSWGDDITPPPQALDWVLDLYGHERDIVAAGQTIIYTLHQTIGHLGIFVSGKVATREHDQFAGCMDMIDLMPPGLYEAIITDVDADTVNPDQVYGSHLFRLEARTLDHIRALGCNSEEDDRRFATVARVSEANLGLYRNFVSPWLRQMVSPQLAETLREMHPHRVRYNAFSDANPVVKAVAPVAEAVRENRRPAAPANPFRTLETLTAQAIETALTSYGHMMDVWKETTFHMIYGSPWLQALAGQLGSETQATTRAGRDVLRDAGALQKRLELEARIANGGPLEALLRSLSYIHRAEQMVDQRAFAVMEQLRAALDEHRRPTFAHLKETLRDQALIVGQDPEAALAALPHLLPEPGPERTRLLDAVRRVALSGGPVQGETAERLARIESIFGAEAVPLPEPVAAK